MKKIKAWIVYGGSPGWYNASLILENGCVIAGHICSDPSYMRGDLFDNRPGRKLALELMGYDVEIQGDPIAGSDKAPDFLEAVFKDEESYKEFSDEYYKYLKNIQELEDEKSTAS